MDIHMRSEMVPPPNKCPSAQISVQDKSILKYLCNKKKYSSSGVCVALCSASRGRYLRLSVLCCGCVLRPHKRFHARPRAAPPDGRAWPCARPPGLRLSEPLGSRPPRKCRTFGLPRPHAPPSHPLTRGPRSLRGPYIQNIVELPYLRV